MKSLVFKSILVAAIGICALHVSSASALAPGEVPDNVTEAGSPDADCFVCRLQRMRDRFTQRSRGEVMINAEWASGERKGPAPQLDQTGATKGSDD